MLITDMMNISSPFHRIHPAAKLAWLLVIAVGLPITGSLTHVIIVAASVWFIVLFAARVPVRHLWQHRFLLFLIPCCLLMFHSISYPGDAIATLGALTISRQGLLRGIGYFFHFSTVIVASLLFVWTTPPRATLCALRQALVPERLAFMVYLGLRFIPLMSTDLSSIRSTQQLRSHQLSGLHRLVQRWRYFLTSAVLNALIRADQLSVSLDIRGFGKLSRRSGATVPHWSWLHLLLPASFVAIFLFPRLI